MDQIKELRFEDFKNEKLEQGYKEVVERRWEPNASNEFHHHEFTADAIVIVTCISLPYQSKGTNSAKMMHQR